LQNSGGGQKMLQLRCQLLSEQWENTLNKVYKMRLKIADEKLFAHIKHERRTHTNAQ
jgi:hypothetical protein